MKFVFIIVIYCTNLTLGLRTGQLFSVLSKQLDQEHPDNMKIPQNKVVNDVKLEKIDSGNITELLELRAKLLDLKKINEKLNKNLKHKGGINDSEDGNDDMVNMLQKYEKTANEIDNVLPNKEEILKNLNVNSFTSKLNDQMEKINFIENKITEAEDKAPYLEPKKSDYKLDIVHKGDIKNKIKVAEEGKFISIGADEYDFKSIKGDSDTIELEGKSFLVIDDKNVPIRSLLKFHTLMNYIKSLCGEEFNRCAYISSKSIEEEAINQTTLLAEIGHLKQLMVKLNTE
jgi:hypothetical protein